MGLNNYNRVLLSLDDASLLEVKRIAERQKMGLATVARMLILDGIEVYKARMEATAVFEQKLKDLSKNI